MVLTVPGRFDNKLVVVTGGASGLGAAMVTRYVAEGAKVLVADMNAEKGKEFCASFPKGTTFFHQCDISTPEGATGVVTAAVEQLGGLDIVHNNASAFGWGAIPDMDPAIWYRVFRVGVDATFYICRAAIPEMRKRGGGAIVNTASTCGLTGDYGIGCYAAAKAAMINLTHTMGGDHARENIRVNAVVPGWMDTPMSAALSATPETKELVASGTPMHRPGKPEEIAAAALFLTSDDASFITGTSKSLLPTYNNALWANIGANRSSALVVDGGLTCVSRMPSLEEVHAVNSPYQWRGAF
jgi:meso-butanediol dehydrogenase/(S,S)-butanediol dehydrogenase/diacetyl reductase